MRRVRSYLDWMAADMTDCAEPQAARLVLDGSPFRSGIRAHEYALARAGVHLRRGRARFRFREPRNHGERSLARKSRLVDLSRANFKRNSRIA